MEDDPFLLDVNAGLGIDGQRYDEGVYEGRFDLAYSHVRRFKQQARKFLACPSSCSAWPPLGKAGGTIMKRRLIML
jgi:hypothetical protein